MLRAAVDAAPRAPLAAHHHAIDHVQGIPIFPEATVVAEAETSERCSTARAAQAVCERRTRPRGGPGTMLRADTVIGLDAPERLGELELVAIDAAGHQDHGAAPSRSRQLGVLAAATTSRRSRTRSASTGWPKRARRSSACSRPSSGMTIEIVVPGHGPVLDRETARASARRTCATCEHSRPPPPRPRAQLPPSFALLHVFAVQPPRPNTDDFEMYDLRGGTHAGTAGRRHHGVEGPTVSGEHRDGGEHERDADPLARASNTM